MARGVGSIQIFIVSGPGGQKQDGNIVTGETEESENSFDGVERGRLHWREQNL